MTSNILFTNSSCQISGAEKSLLDLLSELKRLSSYKYDFYVACPSDGPFPNKLVELSQEYDPVPFFRLRRRYSIFYWFVYLGQIAVITFLLLLIIQKKRIKLIHANSTNALIQSIVAAKIARIPIIWHVRDHIRGTFVEKYLEKKVDFMIAISGTVVKNITRNQNIRVIYNGISIPTKSNDRVLNKGEEFALNSILMIAQLVPWKRHDLLIDAIAILRKKYPNLKLTIIGEDLFNDHPDYRVFLKDKIQVAGLHHQVKLLGYQKNTAPFIDGCLLLVHPAENEPLGRVVIEAMARGKLVLAANSGGIPEYLEDGINGFLFRSGDVSDLAQKMDAILENPHNELVRKQAQKTAREYFDPVLQSRKVADVYDVLLGKRDAMIPGYRDAVIH